MCVLCPRIDPLRFLAGCCRRRLNQGLVLALDFLSLLDRACFCVIFLVYGCMLCLIRYLFVISTSVLNCLGRFVPEMTYYVSSGTLNLSLLKLRLKLALREAIINFFCCLSTGQCQMPMQEVLALTTLVHLNPRSQHHRPRDLTVDRSTPARPAVPSR